MKQLTIQILDKQASFMMELLQKFDFVKIDPPAFGNHFTLTEAQKKSVETERMKCKKDPDYLLDWDSVKNTLR